MYSKERARALRSRVSPVEQRLWLYLRNRKLGGCKFRRQYPIGPYVVDFYCVEARVVVEVDGPTHGLPQHLARDPLRQKYLEQLGVKVFRVTNDRILRDLEQVRAELWHFLNHITSPQPSPSKEREF